MMKTQKTMAELLPHTPAVPGRVSVAGDRGPVSTFRRSLRVKSL